MSGSFSTVGMGSYTCHLPVQNVLPSVVFSATAMTIGPKQSSGFTSWMPLRPFCTASVHSAVDMNSVMCAMPCSMK